MSGRYLTDLATVLRGAGLHVTEVDGWHGRARSSGGYSSGRPTHVMVHHTASGPSSDGWPDVNYMTYSADARPVANLYVNRAGEWWVMAAGATNTNGSGGPLDNVPADSMNTHAIGIEAGNGGTGEEWPDAQQTAYLTACSALCRHYGIPAGHVRAHSEWAPGRKVDPAGPSRWAPFGGTWPMDGFRSDVAAGGTPPPTRKGHRMFQLFTIPDGANPGAVFVTDGVYYRHVETQDALAALQVSAGAQGLSTKVGTFARVQLNAAGLFVDRDGTIGAPNPYG